MEQFHGMDAHIDDSRIHWRGQRRLRHHMRFERMVLPARHRRHGRMCKVLREIEQFHTEPQEQGGLRPIADRLQ